MLSRPGFHTSEFIVALANLVGQVVLALNGTVSDGTAAKYTLAGAIAYIISRGLAKYEPRGTAPPA
jgi:hypothetical protein